MFNLTINHSPDPKEPNQACYHIPKDTPIKTILGFFDALGFTCKFVINSGNSFLDLIDCNGNSRGWLLLSGTKGGV